MVYYTSIQYAPLNEDASIPQGFDMEFSDSSDFVGKRVIYPQWSYQLTKSQKSLRSSNETFNPFRKTLKMVADVYEISQKTYNSMEEKPPLETIKLSDGSEYQGWKEEDHQDEYSEIRIFIIKRKK